MVGEGRPLLTEILGQPPRWSEIADFEPIFACSALAVTPSEKSLINTNRKSNTHFPVSLRLSSYVASPPPKGEGLKNVVSKI